MTEVIQIPAPYDRGIYRSLRCGDKVEITGTIYTARDAAHIRMAEALASGADLPFDISGQVVYYAGPSPAKPGQPIGSCGPTTSGRMDAYTPLLLKNGLRGMIGKGPRSPEVIESMVASEAVYFAAVGGAAALTAKSVVSAEIVAFEDLGPEAIRRLEVVRYPCIVAIDSTGENLYERGPALYRTQNKTF